MNASMMVSVETWSANGFMRSPLTAGAIERLHSGRGGLAPEVCTRLRAGETAPSSRAPTGTADRRETLDIV
jgi:hypothetical protein